MATSRKPATTRRGWVIVGACSIALVYLLATHPLGSLALIGTILGLGWILDRPRARRVDAERGLRVNEDFGSFAHAFELGASPPVDPQAIRAVWDEVMPLTAVRGPVIPLRPSDRFQRDLGIDPDEIEALMPGLVERCGRWVGNWDANPYFEGLATVGALVRFISAQPVVRAGPRAAAR